VAARNLDVASVRSNGLTGKERSRIPMTDSSGDLDKTRKSTDAINLVVRALNAEIAARSSAPNEAASLKANRRFAKAKAAQLSELADIAKRGAKQLDAAKARAVVAINEAEAAGFIVHEDLSVTDDGATPSAARTEQASAHAAAIHSAAGELVSLEENVAAQLDAAAVGLDDMSTN
jgi:hypothetical protein